MRASRPTPSAFWRNCSVSDGLHAPNESYRVEMFQRGIETAIVYLEELARLERRA
ncbi:MAG: hypothetical protein RMK84_15010 [Oscillochloridaceae bacterium]|nr:hypothetical protein [Chloroflexaceae bacterium]MDW8391433.1 hypothetical protein [Oscillochloridaceae bacterium]